MKKHTVALVHMVEEEGTQSEPIVVKEIELTPKDSMTCRECRRTFTTDTALLGSVWECDGCSTVQELCGGEGPPDYTCCTSEDDNGGDYEEGWSRLDGEDGTVEGYVCDGCTGRLALLEDSDQVAYACDECDQIVAVDDVDEHVGEHMKEAMKDVELD